MSLRISAIYEITVAAVVLLKAEGTWVGRDAFRTRVLVS
jgi:hypothetical protein